jgi:hypothetical protein
MSVKETHNSTVNKCPLQAGVHLHTVTFEWATPTASQGTRAVSVYDRCITSQLTKSREYHDLTSDEWQQRRQDHKEDRLPRTDDGFLKTSAFVTYGTQTE